MGCGVHRSGVKELGKHRHRDKGVYQPRLEEIGLCRTPLAPGLQGVSSRNNCFSSRFKADVYLSNRLLSEKEKIVLYVGVGNNAAQVYRRVGFQGLEGNGEVEGVENWLEIGFDRDHVNLGYW